MAQGQSAEEARNSLHRGDWKTFERYAQKTQGLEGRLARARLSLVLGRPDRALAELEGSEAEVLVTRLEALCNDKLYTEARTFLTRLEEDRSRLAPPYDFRFYIYRGEVERRANRPELARKNFQHALRLAANADQECVALDKLTRLWTGVEQLDKAKKTLLEASSLLDEVESVWVAADHLEVAADLEYADGRKASALSMYRASQDIYRAHDNRTQLANSLRNNAVFADFSGDPEKSFQFALQSIEIYLEEQHYAAAVGRLRSFHNLYFQLGKKRKVAEFERLIEQVIARIPAGPAKDEAKASYAAFLRDVDSDKEKALLLAKQAIGSTDAVASTLAHLVAGSLYKEKGHYDEAKVQFELALSKSPGQLMKRDRNWRVSPGQIYLSLAFLEAARHNSEEALDLVRRGLREQPGDDWRYWRIQARYKSLLIAVDAHDEENAVEELSAALLEIEQLPHPVARAGSFTNMLAALRLNQSVGDDVIEPAQYLLGDYGVTASRVINRTFRNPQMVSRYLGYYDEWQQDALLKKETSMQPHPPIYKGLFLEALGQVDEARIALQLGLDIANENKVKAGQMVSQLLLARIALRSGEPEQAADYMTSAAGVAESLNPLAGRFYLLTAGAIQRDVGRFDDALGSFSKAIESNPKLAGPGYFGRALTYEKMGRTEEAMKDIDRALKELSDRGRAVSLARIKGVKARLLVAQERSEEALSYYEEAHRETLLKGASESLDRLALGYADCLTQLGRKTEALEVLTHTLDQFLEWHALNPNQHESLIEQTVQLALQLDEEATALEYLHLSHSAEFLQSLELSQLKTDDPESQQLILELGRLKAQMESLGRRSGNERIGRMLASTRQQFFATLNKLRASEPDFESLVQLSGSQLSSIQQLLSPESIILEYFPAQNKLYVFAVTVDSFTLHEVVISRSDLTKLVDEQLAYLRSPNAKSERGVESSKKLHDLLLGSLDDGLEGIRNLRVVPNGPLWNVSFSSLTQPDGSPVVHDFEVSYLTSSDLARIRRADERPPAVPRKPLLVGGATDLAGAESEILSIAQRLPRSSVISPSEASLEAFLKAVPGSDLIHIASHSRVSTKAGQSHVVLGEETLSLERIYGLDLEPSSLVVLSSCLSAVGVQPPGKEVTSLASAFSVAGASTVVASRWSVDDRTTARFFVFFYEALLKGRRRGQAFQEAELKMSKLYPHPYYWAGFSLFGDPD
jgi:CHAT domain-containing protein/predicted negative regulator of RcsB-dependent stress response